MLSPEETKKLYPLMNVSDIYGTLYSPRDGTIDPAGYCSALTRAASRRGAKVDRMFGSVQDELWVHVMVVHCHSM